MYPNTQPTLLCAAVQMKCSFLSTHKHSANGQLIPHTGIIQTIQLGLPKWSTKLLTVVPCSPFFSVNNCTCSFNFGIKCLLLKTDFCHYGSFRVNIKLCDGQCSIKIQKLKFLFYGPQAFLTITSIS